MDKQINHDNHHDESKTRTRRLSKLPDDVDPWRQITYKLRSKRKTPVEPQWAGETRVMALDLGNNFVSGLYLEHL